MPRRPKGYKEQGTAREQFVARMTDEMDRQGFSDAGLARRVSLTYHMSAATVWKIKKGNPPKRVDIDEATAIALACGFRTLDDFMLRSATTRWSLQELESVMDRIYEVGATVGALGASMKSSRGGLLDIETHMEAGAIHSNEIRRLGVAMNEALTSLQGTQTLIEDLGLPDLIAQAENSVEELRGLELHLIRRELAATEWEEINK